MQVLLIIDGLAGGGAERVTITLAETMTELGNTVTLLSLAQARAYEISDAVQVVTLPPAELALFARRARPFDLIVSNLPAADRAVAAIRDFQDAWFCLHSVASLQLARRHGPRRWWKRVRMQRVYDHRKIITVGAGVAEDITRVVGVRPARVEVIPNPLDIARIQKLAQEPSPLEAERYILHVGRFHRVKRHDRLLRAYAASGITEKLVLLGDGPESAIRELRALAQQLGMSERVLFAGFQENPYSWMRAARALVCSSDIEGFGNALAEALVCGTPVVSTDCPHGPREILIGDLARGLSALDEHSLAAAMRRILDDPPTILPQHYERFDAVHIAQQYLALAQQ